MEPEKNKGGRPRKLVVSEVVTVKRAPGRPVAEPKHILRIRLTVPEYEKVRELGGDKWASRVVREALVKEQQ